MNDGATVVIYNLEEFQQALTDAPKEVFTFVKQEMGRGVNRFRKTFIRERLRGRPGILWTNTKQVGGNVKTSLTGTDLADLTAKVKLSRFLQVHELGATITPKKGPYLFLRKTAGNRFQGNPGKIFAKVKSVTIPARLGFVTLWDREKGAIVTKVAAAIDRGFQVAMERRVKAVSRALLAGIEAL
jgi:hypothetical protein